MTASYPGPQDSVLWLDLETFAPITIKRGAHRYAEEAEIMLAALAWDDEAPRVLDFTRRDHRKELQCEIDEADWVLTHGGFDRTVLTKLGYELPAERLQDTMVAALAHGLPAKLEQLCPALDVPLDEVKDKRGKDLINLFCSPRPKNHKLRRATRETHPAEWAEFVDYAAQDIVAMRSCWKRMPKWNLTPGERELWLLDQTINDRGVAVDTVHAKRALDTFNAEKVRMSKRAAEITGGEITSLTQGAKLQVYLHNAHGIKVPNLQKGNIANWVKDETLPAVPKELLKLRQYAAATSPAKYTVLLNSVCSDGRLRGLIQFCGAARTGRDAGRLFQPQNLPRPSLSPAAVEQGIEAMALGIADMMFDNVAELCISAVRGSLVADEGMKLVVADLSNIEGRVLPWGAGEDWKIDAFKAFDRGEGPDLYLLGASGILGIPIEQVTKLQRQVQGKVPELACGYQGAVGAFNAMSRTYGIPAMDEEDVVGIVKGWRRRHPRSVSFWYAMQDAAKAAIRHPGEMFEVGEGMAQFDMKDGYLRMRLPSGRYLCYKDARVDSSSSCQTCVGKGTLLVWGTRDENGIPDVVDCDDCFGVGRLPGTGQIIFKGLNQYTRQWTELSTYGGKLTENWDQAVSRDIFMGGLRRAERAGYRIVLRVHDELGAEVPDDPRWSAAELSAIMTAGESWSLGLPLAAAGHEMYRYCKLD